MTRRPGLSTTEVLVAVFIMALGTIAILTLFPLGALNMAQAMKDDRTAQAAGQADGYMRWYWKNYVVETGGGSGEPFVRAMQNPNDSLLPVYNQLRAPASGTEPGYPVVVDPIGWALGGSWPTPPGAVEQFWAGWAPPPTNAMFLPRRGLNAVGTSQAQRVCSLLDSLSYSQDGRASDTNGNAAELNMMNPVDRDIRYNWLWILQKPRVSDPYTATMTVVVFDKRAFLYAAPFSELAYTQNGSTPPLTFTPGSTLIQVPYAIAKPLVQKGGWIMDTTTTASPLIRHAIFYRVVSATDNPTNSTTDIELQTPIRRLDGGTAAYSGTFVVLTGVSEVFERDNLTAGNSGQ